MSVEDCLEYFCKNNLFTNKDFRDEAIRLKKEANNMGIHHEAYTPLNNLLRCRAQLDTKFPDKSYCENFLKRYNTTKSNENSSKTNTPKSNTTKTKRCPKGSNRNKKNGMCEPKNSRTNIPQPKNTTKQNTTKRKRCPNGYRFNKKTGMCEAKL